MITSNPFSWSGVLLALTLAVPAIASAAPECVEGSLASFIALNSTGGCVSGAATFSNFSFPAPSATGGTFALESASDILVIPVLIGALGVRDNNPGLFIIPDFSLTSNQPATNNYFLNYTVTAPGLTGADDGSGGFAGTSINYENLCVGATFSPSCVGGQAAELTLPSTGGNFSTVFSQPVTSVDVQNELTLQSANGVTSSIDYLIQGFTTTTTAPIPEAGQATLSAIGLALLGLIWLRRLAKRSTLNLS